MKPCQLCGAKSWGPIDTASTEEIQVHECTPFLLGKDLSQYRRCDGCGTFASLVQMALEDPPRRDPVEESLGILTPGPGNPMAQAFAAMKNVLPVPETRTERLARAILGGVMGSRMDAEGVVDFVRAVEARLDPLKAQELQLQRDLSHAVVAARITDVAQVEVNPEEAVLGSLVWGTYEWNFRARGELLQFLLAGIEHARRRLEGESQRPVVFNINRVTARLIDWLEAGAPRES